MTYQLVNTECKQLHPALLIIPQLLVLTPVVKNHDVYTLFHVKWYAIGSSVSEYSGKKRNMFLFRSADLQTLFAYFYLTRERYTHPSDRYTHTHILPLPTVLAKAKDEKIHGQKNQRWMTLNNTG